MTEDFQDKRIGDAISLIKLLEHFADGQESTDIPWAGIRMTLANCRGLLESSLADSMAFAPLEPVTQAKVRTQNRQDAEGRVREIPARSSTFGRVQLPKNGVGSESLDV